MWTDTEPHPPKRQQVCWGNHAKTSFQSRSSLRPPHHSQKDKLYNIIYWHSARLALCTTRNMSSNEVNPDCVVKNSLQTERSNDQEMMGGWVKEISQPRNNGPTCISIHDC